jgi:hypothetical protein
MSIGARGSHDWKPSFEELERLGLKTGYNIRKLRPPGPYKIFGNSAPHACAPTRAAQKSVGRQLPGLIDQRSQNNDLPFSAPPTDFWAARVQVN